MKFAVVVFASVVAAVSAQQQYRPNVFKPYSTNQYQNPFQNQYQNQFYYKPYSTPAPYRPYVPVSTIAPTPTPYVPVSTVAPVQVPIAKVTSNARNANIVKFGNEINPDGSYTYFYETNNGIAAQEQGTPRNFGGNPPVVPDVAQGSFSWTSPEGVPVFITYIADENGYQASGNAIPTPPPLPPQIARALEYIARSALKN